ncbi:MAG: hypothetical protein HY056_11975, partial [Proteobacteria bacterium]|nr:hypothetical protein [Pseudomonadota bacterium]
GGGGATPRIGVFGPVEWPHVAILPAQIEDIVSVVRATLRLPAPIFAAIALVPVLAYVFYRTPFGLALRACGENPDAIASQGRSPDAIRAAALVIGGGLVAAGGGTFVLTGAGIFTFGALDGRGFAALALAVAVRWRPGWALLATLLFGVVDAYARHLQESVTAPFGMLLALLPMTLALAVLIATSRGGAKARLR